MYLNSKQLKKIFKFIVITVLLVLLGFIAYIFVPNRILSKEEVKALHTLPSSHFIQWRNAEIHYTDEGSGVPILMIHGYGGSIRNFDSITTLLKKDFRVIRVDLPGFGMSDFPSEAVEGKALVQTYKDFMKFFIDSIHVDSLYVVGNSLGGWMTWEMALADTQRVKKIVLLNSAGYDLDKIIADLMPASRIKTTRWIAKRGMPLFVSKRGVYRCWYDPSKSKLSSVIEANHFMNREGNIENFLRLAESGQRPDTSMIKNIKCPALVIWGDDDKIIPFSHAYKFKRDISVNETIVYKNCGHIPQIEMPDQTVADMRKFFAQ